MQTVIFTQVKNLTQASTRHAKPSILNTNIYTNVKRSYGHLSMDRNKLLWGLRYLFYNGFLHGY
jgi:hypothetical protein